MSLRLLFKCRVSLPSKINQPLPHWFSQVWLLVLRLRFAFWWWLWLYSIEVWVQIWVSVRLWLGFVSDFFFWNFKRHLSYCAVQERHGWCADILKRFRCGIVVLRCWNGSIVTCLRYDIETIRELGFGLWLLRIYIHSASPLFLRNCSLSSTPTALFTSS